MYNGYTESKSQTESRRARMEGWTQQHEIMKQVIADVAPRLNLFLEVCGDIDAQNGELSRLDNGVDAVDAQRWQDAPDPLARARAIALPNGQLRSMTSYDTVGSGQCLSAEDVDGEQLGMDDHWHHDNPNY